MTVKHQMQSAVSISALCADSSTGEHTTLGDSKDPNMTGSMIPESITVNKDNSVDVHHRLKDSIKYVYVPDSCNITENVRGSAK